MIITLKKNVPNEEVEKIRKSLFDQGVTVTLIQGTDFNVFGIVGDASKIDVGNYEANPYVDHVTRVAAPYKLVNRMYHPEDTVVSVGSVQVGKRDEIVIMAGPCSVESREQLWEISEGVSKVGASILRGGAYKPRTSPYSFQGLQTEGIHLLKEAGAEFKMPIVSELMSLDKLDEFIDNVDLIQVGARNMQNYELLKALGKISKPILLKRGFSNTIEEWLMSAEYILNNGNPNVILCERGIRTFEPATRNTLDLSVIPLVKRKSHLPIIIDPSHATGDWTLVEAVSLAAIAAGADGLIIEVHNHPEKALSDGQQSLKIDNFTTLVEKGKKIAEIVGRKLV